MRPDRTLSERRPDALRESGNIGLACAATSLYPVIGREIEMFAPNLEAVPFPAVGAFVEPDGPATGLCFRLSDGNSRPDGHRYLVFHEDSGLKLARQARGYFLWLPEPGAPYGIMDLSEAKTHGHQ